MRTKLLCTCITLFMLPLAGCVADVAEEDTGAAEQELLGLNALGLNALGLNALGLNALGLNALGLNSMPTSSLSALQDSTATGDSARELFRYIVSCALSSSQSISFSWTDATGAVHDETYWGSLGLAPSWTSNSLSETGQQIVTACLAARTNYYRTPVEISMRSQYNQFDNKTTSEELASFSYVEGAFWGNLFGSTPYAYSCHVPVNVDHSRASLRDCAAGHLDTTTGLVQSCDVITRLGACSTVCSSYDATKGYYGCVAQVGSIYQTSKVITVGLQ